MLSLSMLGAPVISWKDRLFELRRRQARAMLFVLAAESQTIPRDRLQFLFWPDMPEKKTRRNLSRLLSYLRQALPGEGLIQTSESGVTIDAEGVWCDAVVFANLCAAGETAGVARAVDLYRGPFLDGFSLDDSPEFDLWLTQGQGRYERLYLDALGQLIGAKRADGDFDSAIGYARRYLAVDELSEEVHRRLIGLYASSGDRAAAQRQYENCVAILERELGVAPLPETRAAFEAAMQAEPTVAVATSWARETKPVWTTLPGLELPLIGRESAWRQLAKAYGRLGSGGVIFIAGEPGIGKSRLLQEFATARENRWVLTGNSQETTGDLPYQPIVQALRQALDKPALWGNIRPIWLAEATRILPELNTQFPGLPQPVNVEPQQAQARLFEAISQIYQGLAARQPLLVCLDDLHWADDATLGWLSSLSGRLADSDLCLLATYRSQEARPLTGLLEALSRSGVRAQITLDGLSIESMVTILQQLPVPVPNARSLAKRIQGATAGNPFFALETIRTLWESNRLASPLEALPLPVTVQEAIRGRLERLSPIGRQVLDVAAVLSPELDFEVLQPTAGRSEAELLDGLDELVDHQVLLEEKTGLQFRHDLFRAVVYEDLTLWRRRRLHRRAARAMVDIHRRDLETVAAPVARHYDAAGETEPAVQWYARAADAAKNQYANQDVLNLLERAIVLLENIPEDRPLATRLYESQGDSLVIAGRYPEADAAYQKALELCAEDDGLWLAKLYQELAHIYPPQGRLGESDAIYQKTLDVLGLEPSGRKTEAWWRTWLDVQLSRYENLYFQARLDDMERLVAQIEPIVEQYGTTGHRIDYYGKQSMLLARQKRYRFSQEDLNFTRKAAELAAAAGDAVKHAHRDFSLGFALLWAGQRARAVEHLRQSLAKAEAMAYLPLQDQCLAYLAIASRLTGDIAQARFYQARCAEVAQQVGTPYYIGVAEANQAWLDYLNEEWDLAVANAQKALERWKVTEYPFHWLAHWPLLAISLAKDDLAGSVDSATAMLDPGQQRLSDDLTTALETAIEWWAAGESDLARQALVTALKLAREQGYL